MATFVRSTVRDVERQKEYLRSLEEIVLEDVKINMHSLDECVNLTRVVIGPKVKEIPQYLFEHCHKLSQVEIDPKNLYFTLCGDYVTDKEGRLIVGFGTPRIPDGVKTVSLDSFTREDDVESFYIGKDFESFNGRGRCFRIKNIELSPENPRFELEGNCLFEKDSGLLVLGCDNGEIPARTTKIDYCAFYHCGMKKIHIPGGVERIENGAFEECFALKEAVIEEGVKEIGDWAFSKTALKAIDLPASVKAAGEYAFANCDSLREIKSLGGLSELANGVFYQSGFETLTVPPQIREIGTRAFGHAPRLKEVVIPEGVTTVGKDAFEVSLELKKVTMADSVVSLGTGAFLCCEKLTDVRLSEALTEIPEDCFYKCSALTKIDIPASVRAIQSQAFYFCGRLASIDVSRVKKYPKDAFTGCRKIADVVNPKKPSKLPSPLFSNDTFDEVKETAKKGESIIFITDSLSETVVKFHGTCSYDGHRYLIVKKKETDFFIEITDEKSTDELFEYFEYPFYICKVVSEQDKLFEAIKTSVK